MYATADATMIRGLTEAQAAVARPERPERPSRPAQSARQLLGSWLTSQAMNVTRHAAALRPFHRKEFGTGAASPTDGHIEAVNALVSRLRRPLLSMAGQLTADAAAAARDPHRALLNRVLERKDRAHTWVRAIEKIWDFYFELFGQRQSRYADWLLSCDRIALDCYQDVYMGCGKAKSIPAPPPFAYMRTGFSPATYRRGIPLQKLGRQLNPFPLVQLPYHRLINPWTLGAVLHEVSHNLQSDLGLGKAIPVAIGRRLLKAGFGRFVASTWVRWNRETYADMSGLLLGGPPFVGSLMDILARSPRATTTFVPGAPHPTPYLRLFLSLELMRRMGFADQAERYRQAWTRLYARPTDGRIPRAILDTAERAIPLVVDTICYQPYEALGNKALSQVVRFEPKDYTIMEEAAARLAAGNDPGVVPERFLIGAARIAVGRKLARPGKVAENFYKELARR